MRRALGIGLILVGLAIVAYPLVSVSRLQQQVLDEVPLPAGSGVIIEGKPDRVLFDDDFVLAFRGVGASVEEVEQTLLRAGFESAGNALDGTALEGNPTFVRDCCGAYDAVLVSVFEGRDGITGLRYSVTDDDITSTWYLIAGFGLLIAAIGGGLVLSGRRDESTTVVRNGQNSVSAS